MDDDLRRRAADLQRAAGPDIYSAVEGLSAALTSTVKLLGRMVDQMERGEEELRDAHLDLANALNRRMDDIAESLEDHRRLCTDRHALAMGIERASS